MRHESTMRQVGSGASPRRAPPVEAIRVAAAVAALALGALAIEGCGAPPAAAPLEPPAIPVAAPAAAPLAAPDILGPGERLVLSERPGIVVRAPDGAEALDLEIALDAAYLLSVTRWRHAVEGAGGGAPLAVPIPAGTILEPGEELHLRARVLDASGRSSPWASTRWRNTLGRPRVADDPPAFALSDAGLPVLRWDPVIGARAYEIEIHRDVETIDDATRIAAAVVDAPRAGAAGPLAWTGAQPLSGPAAFAARVRAVAGAAAGDWSAIRRLGLAAPRCIVVTPEPGARLRETRPRVAFQSPAGGAREFEAEIVPLAAGGAETAEPVAAAPARQYRIATTSFRIEDELTRGRRYRLRVREAAAADAAPASAAAWSDPVVFEILPDRADPVPIARLEAGDGEGLAPAVSFDGQRLVCLAPAAGAAGAAPTIRLLRRDLDSVEPRFVPDAPATARFPGLAVLADPVVSIAWDRRAGGDRYDLLVASVACEGGAATRARIHRLGEFDMPASPGAAIALDTPALRLSAPASGDTGRIFFEARSADCPIGLAPGASDKGALGGWGEIWSIGRGGGDARLHGLGACPAVSFDGARLAYIESGAEGVEIVVRSIAPRTGPARRLAIGGTGARARSLAWSPDGTRLALALDEGGAGGAAGAAVLDEARTGYDIIVIDPETLARTPLSASASDDIDPVFLPDPLRSAASAVVVFSSNRDGAWRLYVARVP